MNYFITLFFIFQFSFTQSDFKLIYEKDLNWKDFEVEISENEKLAFLKQIKKFDNKDYFRNHYGYTDNIRDFSFADLNNDNLIDIIYYGYLSSETMISILFMNSDTGFYYLGDIFGSLKQIKKSNLHYRIKTYAGPCCAGSQHTIGSFTLDFTNKKNELNYKKRLIFTEYIHLPKTLLKKEIRFSIMNEDYSLRSSPVIDDSDIEVQVTDIGFMKGNKLTSYPKESKGIAIADSVDSTGRVWWFVVMDPANIDDKYFFPYLKEAPTYYTGWMSSRYLSID